MKLVALATRRTLGRINTDGDDAVTADFWRSKFAPARSAIGEAFRWHRAAHREDSGGL